MIKKLFFLLIIPVFFLSSCNDTGRSEKGDLVVITDMLGREVAIPEKIESIVGVRAGSLRLLIYMDAVNMIAGVENWEKNNDTPYILAYPELKDLPPIGPSMGGDPEMILNVGPDVIFISYTTVEDANKLQSKTGIPVVAIECVDLDEDREILFESFRLIGEVLQKKERAEYLISYISNTIDELNSMTKNIKNKPSVYVGGISYSSGYGISSTHAKYAPFLFLNANNVASDIDERLTSHVKGTFVDTEQLIKWNPKYIFIDESGYSLSINDFTTKPVLKRSLQVFENDDLYLLLAYNNYATNYEFVLLNAWYIGKIIYPEEFKNINFNQKKEELFKAFYNKKNVGSDILKSSLPLQRISISDIL